MKKGFIKFSIIVLSIIIIFTSFIIYTELKESPFKQTYEYELLEKCSMLKYTEGKRLIFVGNSSVPFGIQSELIQSEFGDYHVIDFGLYASIGTKSMLEILKKYVRQDDVVILMPEINEQTMSLYYNTKSLAYGLDGFSKNISDFSFDDKLQYFYGYYKYAFEKLSYKNGDEVSPVGIYRKDSFNSYGDVCVEREYNIMDNCVDDSMYVYINTDLITDEYTEYLNDYNKFILDKKAILYYAFAPLNSEAIMSSKNAINCFVSKLQDKLTFSVIGDIYDSIIDKGYFYDTNYHLNSSGSIYFTNNIINTLMPILKNESTRVTEFDIPAIPEVQAEETVVIDYDNANGEKINFEDYNGEPNIDYVDVFEYKLVGASYQIISVKSEYENIRQVILPSVYNGKNVTSIKENTFINCKQLEEIYIGNTYKSLIGKVFNGCISCKKVYLFKMDSNKINVSTSDLLEGASVSVQIVVPKDSNYLFGYSWENYRDRIIYHD